MPLETRKSYRLLVRRVDGTDRKNLYWPSINLAVRRAAALVANEPGLHVERWADGSFVIDERGRS